MEHSKLYVSICLCLVAHSAFAQQSTSYAQRTQKVQLADIEQDNLKNVQQASSNQASTGPQFAQYSGQNQPPYYSLPQQQIQQQTPVAPATSQQVAHLALFSLPAHGTAAAEATAPPSTTGHPQPFVFYTQAPQQLSPYELPQYLQANPFGNLQVVQPMLDDYYKSLQQQSNTVSKTAGSMVVVPQQVKTAAAPLATPIPYNYFFASPLPQAYFQQYSWPQTANSQFLAYNSVFPLPANPKNAFSAGFKSTTPAAPTKVGESLPSGNSNYRFEYNTDFNKLRG